MTAPKISVIIPIYGTEKYLDKCLNSVRKQTFKEFEIICVDDCSPDNSYKIVEKHCKQDKRVKLIRHEKNLGLGGARNTGIRAAKAEYLASVDSDDYISKNMLETLWEATDKGWFDIVCCGFSRVDENGNILSKQPYIEKQVSNEKNSIDIFTTLNPAFWNKLWRKSLFVDNDIYFPEHDYYEDMSTTPRILAKARYIKGIKDTLYRYLIRDQSIMNSVSDKHIIDYLKGFEIISEFLKENDLSLHYEEEFHRFIQGNFNYYAKFILNSTLSMDKKTQYLRFLILFRITFTENFKKFNYLDINKLLTRLGEEDLHGVYYDSHQRALAEIKKKEGLITRHWSEIESKAERIEGFRKDIQELKVGLNEARDNVDKSKKKLITALQGIDVKDKSIDKHLSDIDRQKQVIEDQGSSINQLKEDKNRVQSEQNNTKEVLSKTQNNLKEAKEALSKTQNNLKGMKENLSNTQNVLSFTETKLTKSKLSVKNLNINLERTKEDLTTKQERVVILEEEVAEKVSFAQMFAVFLFAFFTYLVMSKQQTIKLINKPKMFFRDSKSGFAKAYASWFNII